MLGRFRTAGARRAVVLAAALVVSSCSDGDRPLPPTPVATTLAPVPATLADEIGDAGDADEPPMPAARWSVSIEVVAEGFDAPRIDDEVSSEFDPSTGGDVFGSAAFCSGLHTSVATYSVLVSDASAATGSVGVWTSERVTGPGVFDAEMRVERDSATYLATGTVTLGDDLQRGEFVGFGPTGGTIEGSFECGGAEPPTPLELGSERDTTLDSVEVVALLRFDGRRRVVTLASGDVELASCPAVEGTPLDAAFDVAGDAELGAITEFAIDEGSLRLMVGGVRYEFDAITFDADGGAGAFGAMNADGIAVDGAFRCT